MNGKTYINGDELTALANSLKSKGENLLNAYKGDCAQAIEMSTDCLQLSGLNTTEFFQALEKIYTQVNERIISLSDFLTNVVVAEYNAVSEAITNSFNVEFANEISSLLGISVSASIGGVVAPTIPGRPNPYKPGYGIGINPSKPGDQVIELDPREKEGFGPNEPKDQPITVEKDNKVDPIREEKVEPPDAEITPVKPDLPEKDGEIKAVAFDDDGKMIEADTGVKPVKPEVTETPASVETTQPVERNRDIKAVAFDDGTTTEAATGVKPVKPEAVETPTPVETTQPVERNRDIKAVAFDDGTSTPAATGVKPNLPSTPEPVSPKPSDRSVSAVYLDDNGKTVSAGGPIKPTPTQPSTPSVSAPVVTKPTTKQNLPPLTSGTSRSGSSSVSFGTAYSGGGGGASMAETIAFDSMANPLRRFK